MNYNININQKAIAKLNEILHRPLDLKDATILEWMMKFHAEPKSKKLMIDGQVYFWGAYQLIINENPLLNIQDKKKLSVRITKLIDAKLLLKYLNKDKGNKTYFCITQRCFDLMKRDYTALVPQKEQAIPLKETTLVPFEGNNNNIIDNTTTTIIKKLLDNQQLVETTLMQNKGIDIETKINEFANYCISIKKTHNNDTDLYQHFMSWYRQNKVDRNRDVSTEITWFIDNFNKLFKTTFLPTSDVRALFIKQLENKFTGEQMLRAAANMRSSNDKNKWHKETGYVHATPLHLLKDDNLNKYLNQKY